MAREHIEIALPRGFDPNRHATALFAMIVKEHGDGWEIGHIDPEAGTASAFRQNTLAELKPSTKAASKTRSFEINLPKDVKPADGEKWEARLEDQYGGFYLTGFEPFLGKAVLTKLNDETARARGALAVALGIKRWEVQVIQRVDGGFDIVLPRTYTPSRHDSKLGEVATSVVGRDGWYVDINAAKLTASIIPSDPPTFPHGIPYPMASLRSGDWHSLRLGRLLPAPGSDLGPEISIDWVASSWVMVAGTPGSGKSVSLNAAIGGALADGCQLAIIDIPAKSVDFMWCRNFVRPGGWGCESAEAAVAAFAMIYEEGQRRAGVLKTKGVVNWLDLPAEKQFQPILVIVDEVSGLLVPRKAPGGIPKTHPLMMEVIQENLLKAAMASYIDKIIAELRFVGIRMILASQVTNNNTGIGPSLKAKIGHKILQGSNPSRSARGQAFNDESAVPYVPGNVRADAKVAKGVGVAEMEGSEPKVYKSYFATVDDYAAALTAMRIPTTDRPAPTASEIAKYTPSLEDSEPQGRSGTASNNYGFDDGVRIDPNTGEVLSGFGKANAARRELDRAAGTARPRKDEMALAGPVTITRKTPLNPGATPDDDFE